MKMEHSPVPYLNNDMVAGRKFEAGPKLSTTYFKGPKMHVPSEASVTKSRATMFHEAEDYGGNPDCSQNYRTHTGCSNFFRNRRTVKVKVNFFLLQV
jgi:hypothetical protein